ncbi:hypothetical protein C8Q78DRAFT_974404, partial [Trametes maxima]
SSERLSKIQQEIPRWIWDECLRVLRREDAITECFSEGYGSRYARPCDLERPMSLTVPFASRYDPRPDDFLPSSPTVDAVRALLEEAPQLYRPEGEEAMYYDPDGLEKYEWPSEYLESLFCALCDLITAHGVGDAGWRSIRWEVYDKYTECVKGISYQREERGYRWIDEAIHWLGGQYSTELKWTDISFARSSRAQASAGTRYNSMLPWLR